MERSASRLLGRARSKEVSTGMAKATTFLRFCFAIIEMDYAKSKSGKIPRRMDRCAEVLSGLCAEQSVASIGVL
jgi:hypothetical protein